MAKNSVIQVSGRGTNVDFTIDDKGPFEEVSKGLREYLVENRGLWSGGEINVNVGARLASLDQLNEFRKIIEAESGLKVMRFSCDPASLEAAFSKNASAGVEPLNAAKSSTSVKPVIPSPQHNVVTPSQTPIIISPDHYEVVEQTDTAVPSPQHKEDVPQPDQAPPGHQPNGVATQPEPVDPGLQHNVVLPPPQPTVKPPQAAVAPTLYSTSLDEDEPRRSGKSDYVQSKLDSALLVKSTCRSGEIIRYQGDVVVLGDVNPGAEVLASGDIVVFGSLRGFAHAGAEGNTKATIMALILDSPRIQIGPHVGVSQAAGQQPKSTGAGPVIAYVRRRSIHVTLFAGRFAKYGRGELYDR